MSKNKHLMPQNAADPADYGSSATAELPQPADPQPNGDPVNPAQPAAVPGKRVRKAPLAPKGETKEERFRRIAPRRVKAAVKRIAQVANLANTASYRCTDAQREWLQAKIIKATEDLIRRFGGGAEAEDDLAMPV